MKYFQIILIFLFFIYAYSVNSQSNEPTFKEAKKADKYFYEANLLKEVKDEKYKDVYLAAINSYKTIFQNSKKSTVKVYCLTKVAHSYYNIEDYKNSAIYFRKILCVGKITQPDNLLMLGLSLAKLKDCNEAIQTFKEYGKLTGDSLKARELIEQCN